MKDHRLPARWTVILLLGLRRSEVCGLRRPDVDLEAGTLRIARGVHRVNGSLTALPTKTRRSKRTVPLPALCVQALTDYRDAQDQLRADQGVGWVETGYLFTTRHGSNPATSPATSATSANNTGYAASGCTPCGTPA